MPIRTTAKWAEVMRTDSEAAGHSMAVRIMELAEAGITKAIREATWKAMNEILEADSAA